MTPAELDYLTRFGPTQHARTARLIDLCIAINERISTRLRKRGGCNCDVGGVCEDHNRTPRIAERYLRRLEKRP
jgi:hypothetical protein